MSFAFAYPVIVQAETGGKQSVIMSKMKIIAEKAGYSSSTDENTLRKLLGNVVKAFLSLLGAMFLFFMIYAGWKYLSARGEEEKVAKSLATIRQAIIGLIIIIGSYAMWYFISTFLLK